MRSAFKYLNQHCFTTPRDVDSLIISAFLQINNLPIDNNILIREYVINENKAEEYLKLIQFVSIIKEEISNFGFEELIELFEFVISPADRVVNGAIYTPAYIREYMVNESLRGREAIGHSFKVADVACGCSGFLFNVSKELKRITNRPYSEIFRDHIFGLDIQDYSINRSKLLLSLLALEAGEDEEVFEFNLYQGDSLDFNWSSVIYGFEGFSVILGNPPYVCARNLDIATKEKLKNWDVCKSGNSDLYIPFFQIGIENLAPDGLLGFITMNSFFKSLNGRALRDYFQRKELAFNIIDFGAEQVFKSKNTYTCICFIENRPQPYILYTNSESTRLNQNHNFNQLNYRDLDSKTGWKSEYVIFYK